jgi:methylmalonyl-CoA mutase N-terminal domain/subunit
VNRFKVDEPVSMKLHQIDPQIEKAQIDRLTKTKRKPEEVRQLLENLKDAARGDTNLMVPNLEAVKAYATLGEICGTLKQIFGEYYQTPFFCDVESGSLRKIKPKGGTRGKTLLRQI